MSQIFGQPFEEVVKMRYSVRTYANKPLPLEIVAQLEAYIQTLSNPFSEGLAF